MNDVSREAGRPLLVVDDDRKLCGLIRDCLGPLGWRVEMRHNGIDGLEEARGGGCEAVIPDVMMRAWTASRCCGNCGQPRTCRC